VSALPIKLAGPLKEHDKVRMIGGEVTGTVLSVKGKNAIVQFGELRSSVKTDRLVRSDLVVVPKTVRPVTRGIELHQRQSDFSPVLDVRGKRVEELLPLAREVYG